VGIRTFLWCLLVGCGTCHSGEVGLGRKLKSGMQKLSWRQNQIWLKIFFCYVDAKWIIFELWPRRSWVRIPVGLIPQLIARVTLFNIGSGFLQVLWFPP
jgi:hypothetical protein